MCDGGRRPAKAPELTRWRLALLADVSNKPVLATAAVKSELAVLDDDAEQPTCYTLYSVSQKNSPEVF